MHRQPGIDDLHTPDELTTLVAQAHSDSKIGLFGSPVSKPSTPATAAASASHSRFRTDSTPDRPPKHPGYAANNCLYSAGLLSDRPHVVRSQTMHTPSPQHVPSSNHDPAPVWSTTAGHAEPVDMTANARSRRTLSDAATQREKAIRAAAAKPFK